MPGPFARLGHYLQDLLEDHRQGYRRYLVPEERRVFAVRRHWAILVPPAGMLLAGLVVTGAALWYLPSSLDLVKEVCIWGCAALTGYLAWQLWQWRTERFVATDQRVLLTQGLLYRRVGTLPLIKVTDLSYERSVFGRIVGYGTFVFESAGQDQAMRQVTWVPCPDVTYRLLVADMFKSPADPYDVAHMAERMGHYDDVTDLLRVRPHQPSDPLPPHEDASRPIPVHLPVPDAGADSGADSRTGSRVESRADTIYRSADLRAARDSVGTAAIPYYRDGTEATDAD